jgi:molybdate-binding protein
VLRVHATHGFAVETLRQFLTGRQIPIDLKYRDSDEALTAFIDRQCDVIGLHLPIGDLEREVAAHYAPRIQNDWTMIHLATRRQGLIVAPGNPKCVGGVADLTRQNLRFVNRQGGSGTRLLFDLLLARAGVDTREIDGYEILEYTHAAVAAYVGSGMADAGFGLEVPARRFGLDFLPLVTERYFFLCRNDFLADPAMRQFDSVLHDTAFRERVAQLPGYDPSDAGRREPARNAFPQPRAKRRAAIPA